ncbi:SAM-dependent methyltransferase, MidA family [Seinonella peptonophila]|uniref:SAM-dependent methyltransferase, MidA family n=1 Tax=Seinonella peptonophila TaxID=112248 RepID=A0A1M4V0E2_9BACL|nr:SAM-dependent methyltransferase [Seinonella peptonophila]SHE62461.1 SAM-dependent methyltransferase, MidA family [Seinonella peptonophila]
MIDSHLVQQIAWEIKRSNEQVISFYRLMELALYHPQYGYYHRRQPKVGKAGDFFTSVSVGAPFAYGVAEQVYRRLPNQSVALVEWGAGDGTLMKQVLHFLERRKVPIDQLTVFLLETSDYHQDLARQQLVDTPYPTRYIRQLNEIPVSDYAIIYSNELLDAFPVRRYRLKRGILEECYVALNSQGEFEEKYLPVKGHMRAQMEENGWLPVEEGVCFEYSPQIKPWLLEIEHWLHQGYVMTIDYGGTIKQIQEKQVGTIRYYYQHKQIKEPYEHLGEIDMTSDVPFDYLLREGQNLGWQTDFYGSQARFLIDAGILDMLSEGAVNDPFSVEAKQRRMITQLIHPEAMGERFQVLIQKKSARDI